MVLAKKSTNAVQIVLLVIIKFSSRISSATLSCGDSLSLTGWDLHNDVKVVSVRRLIRPMFQDELPWFQLLFPLIILEF